YETLTGRLPFEGSLAQIVFAKQERDPPAPRALVPDVPADLSDLCMRLLARDPAARPDGAEVLALLGAPEVPRPQPVDVSVLTPLGDTPFVGRERELAELARAHGDARTTAVTLLVHGESGVGKSALVRRFTDGLAAADHEVLVLAG